MDLGNNWLSCFIGSGPELRYVCGWGFLFGSTSSVRFCCAARFINGDFDTVGMAMYKDITSS